MGQKPYSARELTKHLSHIISSHNELHERFVVFEKRVKILSGCFGLIYLGTVAAFLLL